jgi:hypothetical protein
MSSIFVMEKDGHKEYNEELLRLWREYAQYLTSAEEEEIERILTEVERRG